MGKVLVSDYDGTFYTDDISFGKNKEAIQRFMKDGNTFAIATGRTLLHFKEKIINQNTIIQYNYIICIDGAAIFDNKDKLVFSNDIDMNSVEQLSLIFNNNPNLYDLSYTDGYHKFSVEKTDTVSSIGIRCKDIEQAEKLMKELKNKYSINYRLLNDWIKIVSKDVSKGEAIEYMRNTLNLDKKDVYVIGNEENDVSMITMFNGSAMKSCAEVVKKLNVKEYNQVYELVDEIATMNSFDS